MSVSTLPFYSTTYGEGFGYNERDGSNSATFRNRYDNEGYRGTAELGPVRFNAQRAAQTMMGQTQPFAQTVQATPAFAATMPRPQSQQQPFRYGGEAISQQQRPHTQQQPRRWDIEANRSSRLAPEQFYSVPPPAGAYSVPSARSMYVPIQPAVLQSPASVMMQTGISVQDRPYYIAPYEQPPSTQFAPQAESLGNKTYSFKTHSPDYAYSSTFDKSPYNSMETSSKPLADPGQSIPFGRLHADNAADVRMKMSLASWDTFHVANRDNNSNYNLAGIKQTSTAHALARDPENYCKTSISRRLQQGSQLRYQLPGYMGAVGSIQFRHGSTYGKTTRECIMGSKVGI